MGDALGVPNRVGDRYGAALGDAEQRETIDTRGIDDGFEVANEVIEGDVGHLAIGKTVAPRIVADEGVLTGQLAVKMPPDRAFQVEFEMVIQLPVLTIGGPWPVLA